MQSQVRQVKQIYLKYLFYFIDDQMIKTRKPNTNISTVPKLNRNITETAEFGNFVITFIEHCELEHEGVFRNLNLA
jgi:hypothetical protein